jgi:hypothetical protein
MKALLLAMLVAACGVTDHDVDHDHDVDQDHDHDDGDDHEHVITAAQITHRAVTNGPWHHRATWNTATVPGDGAGVLIPAGISVGLRTQEAARLAALDIRGTLTFASTVSTRLLVETIEVRAGGTLQIGSANAPVARDLVAEIVFIDTGSDVLPTAADPTALRRGLIAMGNVRFFGAPKTPFATVAGAIQPNAGSVTLEAAPTGWRRRDVLVIPSTRFRKDSAAQNEYRAVSSVAASVVQLDAAVDYRHRVDPSMRVHVGNLTRNVVLRSETTTVPRRGHVMLMNCGGTQIDSVQFQELGRTDKSRTIDDATNVAGRYPVHFHRCGLDQGQARVSGSTVVGSPGWSMVNHGSRVAFANNVAAGFVGAGFVAEDGNELGSFTGNLAVGGTGVGGFALRRVYLQTKDRVGMGDFAFHGDCFWFQSPLVSVHDNVAAGCKGAGFFFHALGLNRDGGVGFPAAHLPALAQPLGNARSWSPGSGYNGLLIVDLPIVSFTDNTAYGNFIGIKIRYVQNGNGVGFAIWGRAAKGDEQYLASRMTERLEGEYAPMIIARAKLWNNFVGVHNSYTSFPRYQNLFIGTDDAVPTTDLEETWVGWEADHNSARAPGVNDMTIKGYPVGMMINPDPNLPYPITGYRYFGNGQAVREVDAGNGVRE